MRGGESVPDGAETGGKFMRIISLNVNQQPVFL